MESKGKGEMIDALARIHQYRITNNDRIIRDNVGDPLFRENPYFVLIEQQCSELTLSAVYRKITAPSLSHRNIDHRYV